MLKNDFESGCHMSSTRKTRPDHCYRSPESVSFVFRDALDKC